MDTVSLVLGGNLATLTLPTGERLTTTPDGGLEPSEWADRELTRLGLLRTTGWVAWLADTIGGRDAQYTASVRTAD